MKLIKTFFYLWGLVALGLWLFSNDLVTTFSAVGVIISGLSTLLFWKFRKPLLSIYNLIPISPKIKFILIGSLCAMWLEFEFWVIEMLTGAVGVAADQNLFLDLLGTMPWYIVMVWLLYKVELKYSYSFFGILMLGGIYDFFADGILGAILGSGGVPMATLLLMIIIFPIFIISYSFIVLPPTYFLQNDKNIQLNQKTGWKKYLWAPLPLLGLLAYGFILTLLL